MDSATRGHASLVGVPRILSRGCWNCIVLKNLSRRLPPSVQLDGFDISFEAVPTQEWLPPNMKLIHWDNKTDVPKETEGRYDVMHLRHFIFVLLAEEIKYTLEKLLKLLKPGGYLQWSEVDMTSFRVEKTRSGVSTQALTAMVNNPKAQTRACDRHGCRICRVCSLDAASKRSIRMCAMRQAT
ncbi:hypothetical protein AFLA_012773 [Aspergillus flavus NRRL3357]|nr:hypothetical protein AFLA_012773 [Aspergillus flavus NRRL3357]